MNMNSNIDIGTNININSDINIKIIFNIYVFLLNQNAASGIMNGVMR